MAQTTINNQTITIPENVASLIPKQALQVPLNGDRIDNIANALYGNNLDYPRVAQKNNIGFLYDVPADAKVSIW